MQVKLLVLSFSVFSDGVRDCFIAYVTTKVVKQAEDFKARYTKDAQPRKVLLPLSLGPSSLSLLHLLGEHYSRQLQKTNRIGFKLHVLHIADDGSNVRQAFEGVRERFPSHTYGLLPLHGIFHYHPNLNDIFSTDPCSKHTQDMPTSGSIAPAEKLAACLSSIPSASSKEDILRILRLRLIVAYAKENGCDCITWGDSITRLAEKTLAETAKGRGISMPWQIGEGQSPYGIEFKFPMRGLLRREIIQYSCLTSPALTPLIVDEPQTPSASISSKDVTLDALMGRYFASVEKNYPSIVTNVVRTANRLEAPQSFSLGGPCEMCGIPFELRINDDLSENGQGINSPKDAMANGGSTKRFCHGCSTSLLVYDRRT